MVIKKKKKAVKKVSKKVEEESDEHEGGASLDDAFGDDSDVEYAPSKPKKKNKIDEEEEEIEEELDEIEAKVNGHGEERGEIEIKASKPIAKVKKGDRIVIDGVNYEVDAHEVLIDHGSTKEMAIEIFNPATDKDYQLRYFNDQVQTTLDLYELQEILYVKKHFKKVEW